MKHLKLFENFNQDKIYNMKKNESFEVDQFDSEAIQHLFSRKNTKMEDLEKLDGRTRNLILHYYEAGFIDGRESAKIGTINL